MSSSSFRKSDMDSSSHKDYHDDLYDPIALMDTYNDPENKEFVDALVIHPGRMLMRIFSSGMFKIILFPSSAPCIVFCSPRGTDGVLYQSHKTMTMVSSC